MIGAQRSHRGHAPRRRFGTPLPRLVDHWIGSIDNVDVCQGAVPSALIGSIP